MSHHRSNGRNRIWKKNSGITRGPRQHSGLRSFIIKTHSDSCTRERSIFSKFKFKLVPNTSHHEPSFRLVLNVLQADRLDRTTELNMSWFWRSAHSAQVSFFSPVPEPIGPRDRPMTGVAH